MRASSFLTILSLLLLPSAHSAASELSVKEAVALIDLQGDTSQRERLAQWRNHTKLRRWDDRTGQHSSRACYISSSDSSVILKKENLVRVNVPLKNLSLASRKHIMTVRDLESQIIADALALSVTSSRSVETPSHSEYALLFMEWGPAIVICWWTFGMIA